MADLFISYSSHDRPWAERLFDDLRTRFPTIEIFWDRDPHSLPPGTDWRRLLEDNAEKATHLAIVWSEAAKASNEVGPEIQAFRQNVKVKPTSAKGARRKTFYIPLEGEYGWLQPVQGFAELRRNKAYSPAAADRGVSNLANEPHSAEWQRLVRIIGNTVLAAEATQPIKLALLVMSDANTYLLDPVLNQRTPGGPTLQEFLNDVGLTLNSAKKRYGPDAFSWRPFGTGKTVIDLMEDVRENTNRNLSPEYRFDWMPCDFVQEALDAKDAAAFRGLLESLAEGPSAIVTDPISLFNPIVARVFARLGEYATKEHSVIVSISPNEMPAADRLYQCLLSNGAPVLDTYLLPHIPATGTFARCGINVQHVADVERLIRGSLGFYHLQRKKAEAKPLVSSGV